MGMTSWTYSTSPGSTVRGAVQCGLLHLTNINFGCCLLPIYCIVYLSSWFPVSVGQLRCIERPSDLSKVNSLAWDALNEVLYLGGVFDAVDYRIVTTGLLMWTKATGLVSFPGGGVGNYINGPSDAFVKAIAYDADSQVRLRDS